MPAAGALQNVLAQGGIEMKAGLVDIVGIIQLRPLFAIEDFRMNRRML